MSEGPRKIGRAIEAAFAAEPDRAFTTSDLCEIVYGCGWQVRNEDPVAVLHAAKDLIIQAKWPEGWMYRKVSGETLFFNARSKWAIRDVQSAIAQGRWEPDLELAALEAAVAQGVHDNDEAAAKQAYDAVSDYIAEHEGAAAKLVIRLQPPLPPDATDLINRQAEDVAATDALQ